MKNIKNILLQLLQGAIIGAFIGAGLAFLMVILEFKVDFNLADIHFVSKILITLFAFIFMIFVHELGHLVFGLLTGYEFSSFRLLFFHVQKSKEDKIQVHFHHVPNTLGQCLMNPPKTDDIPIFWYNFGGVFFNIIFSALTFVFVFLINNNHVLFFLMASFALNIFSFGVNWIPMKGAFNDGVNYRLMKKNPKTKKAFFYLLDLNEQLRDGVSIKAYDFEEIENLNLTGEDHIQLNVIMFLVYHYQLRFETEKYEALLNMLYPIALEQKTFLHLALQVDYYFMKLLLGYEDFANYYTKDVKRYLNSLIKDEKKMLIKLVISFYKNLTYDEIDYQAFVKACESSIAPGFSMDLLEYGNILLDR